VGRGSWWLIVIMQVGLVAGDSILDFAAGDSGFLSELICSEDGVVFLRQFMFTGVCFWQEIVRGVGIL
jgi:hypothetical protein